MDLEQELYNALNYEICVEYFKEQFPEVGLEEIKKFFNLAKKNAADALVLYQLCKLED